MNGAAAGESAAPPARRTPPKLPRPEPAPLAASPAVTAFERRLAGAPSSIRADLVAEFWATHRPTPLVEPVPQPPADARGPGPVAPGAGQAAPREVIVTFLWRDAGPTEVLMFANRLTDERGLAASLMAQVTGTDIWHLSYRLGSDWRASYGFVPRLPDAPWPWAHDAARAEPVGAAGIEPVDQVALRRALDQCLPDPTNPARNRNRAGWAQSVVALPDAPPQLWLEPREPASPPGNVTEQTGPDGRRIWVYRPPGAHPAPAARQPLLVVLDGEVWCGPQNLAVTLDNLIADNLIEPPLALLVDSGGRDHRWAELDGSGAAPAWIADKLVPWALAGLRPASPLAPVRGAAGGEVGLGLGETASDTGGEAAAFVVVAGQSLGALTALRAALERGDVVRGAIAQSASLWQRDLGAGLAGRDLSGLRAYVEVGAQEWVLREPNRRLAQHLAAAGANVHFNEYNGGHDYACWRGGIADALRWMLPPRI